MIMRYRIASLIVFVLLSGLFACQRTVDHEDLSPRVQEFLKSDEGTFRGLDFDTDILNVENKEGAELVEKDDGYLLYNMNREGYTAEIGYYFDGEEKLNMIRSTLSFDDEATRQLFMEELTKYYNSLYVGGTDIDERTRMWEFNATSGQQGSVEITMKTTDSNINLDFIKYYEY